MASTYLSRTCGSTASSYTVSMWVRTARTSGSSTSALWWNGATNKLNWELNSNGQIYIYLPETRTSGYYRDVGAWYHLVWSVNSNVGTLYVNGVADSGLTNVSSIASLNSTNDIQIGGDNGGSTFDGSMAHVHFIDGTAYDASTFGETDATTGIWKPKTAPSVTYGTNGFFLKFENSGAFGTDSSGNGNNFTVNGTMTQTIDTPSNVFCTLNPLVQAGSTTAGATYVYSNGNTTLTGGTSKYIAGYGSLAPTQGKWYYEMKLTTYGSPTGSPIRAGWGSVNTIKKDNEVYFYGLLYDFGTGTLWSGNSGTGSSVLTGQTTFTQGDIVGVAVDLTNDEITYYKNGTVTSINGYDYSGTTTSIKSSLGNNNAPYILIYANNSNLVDLNFGNGYFGTTAVASAQNPDDGIGIFEYSVPTGYKALCTKSINAQEYS